MKTTDTIAAIATGNTISAIGIVRISGPKALTAADNVFRTPAIASLKDAQDRRAYYGKAIDAEGELIDTCLCTISRAPNSYTGEDTAELHCHGSPVVLAEVLRALTKHGVRLAEAGEFTKRAFLNGKIDLTQAEAVIDIIEAETPIAAKNAAGQLEGAVYTKITAIYDKLLDIMAHFHAVIDYPDEDIDEFKAKEYLKTLRESEAALRNLQGTFDRGRLLKNGIPTAIVGRTNTGKSSLLNALLGYERAIVTDIHGTTRDTIEEKVLIGKVLLRLIDTAGLRKTDDRVEKLGLERTLAAIKEAGLILAVLDGTEPLQPADYDVLNAIPPETPHIIVVNKNDKVAQENLSCSGSGCRAANAKPRKRKDKFSEQLCCISISAKTGDGLPQLEAEIQKLFPAPPTAPTATIITNARQAEAITKAADSLSKATEALTASVSPDAVLTDVEAALTAIGEVTGKTIREDIIARIFDRFCVGK